MNILRLNLYKKKFNYLVMYSGQCPDEMGLQWECSCETFELDGVWWRHCHASEIEWKHNDVLTLNMGRHIITLTSAQIV